MFGCLPLKKEIIYTTPCKAHMTEKGVGRTYEPENRRKSYEMSSPGKGIGIAIMISKQPWLSALDLHKNGPINSQAWREQGLIDRFKEMEN